jgi:hypothetical protein
LGNERIRRTAEGFIPGEVKKISMSRKEGFCRTFGDTIMTPMLLPA